MVKLQIVECVYPFAEKHTLLNGEIGMKKRISSLVLSLLLIITLLPVSAFAVDSQTDLLSDIWEGMYVGSVANSSHGTIYRTFVSK